MESTGSKEKLVPSDLLERPDCVVLLDKSEIQEELAHPETRAQRELPAASEQPARRDSPVNLVGAERADFKESRDSPDTPDSRARQGRRVNKDQPEQRVIPDRRVRKVSRETSDRAASTVFVVKSVLRAALAPPDRKVKPVSRAASAKSERAALAVSPGRRV